MIDEVILSKFRAIVICRLSFRDRWELFKVALHPYGRDKISFLLPLDSELIHPFVTTWKQDK